MLRKGLIIFCVLFFVFFALKTSAQIQNSDIVLEINPKYPKANEEVKASVSTYTTDLNSARISWILNGETMLEGIGKKNFSFRISGSDFQSVLEVKIETITGASLSKRVVLSSAGVDMLWEAYDTYVPPFYKGKKIAPVEGMIKVIAFPNTQSIMGLNYKWILDGKSKPSSSGYEKNYFIYKNTYLEANNKIEATVSDIFGNGIGSNSITIKPGNPKIVFYKKDPTLGIKWENSLSDYFTINPDGETLVAEPYFFYPKNLNASNVSIKWFLNGEETKTPFPKNKLSLKPASKESGNGTMKVVINNINTLFESAEKQLNVSF